MIYLIIVGFFTGLIVSFSFGAGFFSIIQTSIAEGERKAFLISLGLIISDIIFILLTVFATTFISEELLKYSLEIRIIGMVMLVSMGIYLIKKSVQNNNANSLNISSSHFLTYMAKGYFINTLNPLTIITWIGISLFVHTALEFSIVKILIYYSAIVISLFLSQYGVCHFANRLGKWLSAKHIHQLNIAVGVIIIALGFLLYFSKNIESTNNPIDKVQQLITPKKPH